MKTLIVPFLLLLLTISAFAQASKKPGPSVNGIPLGATREEVIKKLGKPTSETKRKAEECVGGTEITLTYPGLKFSLWDDAGNPKKFTVGKFDVTSAKWDISGARIGQTKAEIVKLFGKPLSEDVENGVPGMYYIFNEDTTNENTNFKLRGSKVFRITSMFLMC